MYTFKIDLYLPEFSATKVVMWKCHADDSTRGQNHIIIDRYILNTIVIYIKFSNNTIKCSKDTYQGCTSPMVDIIGHGF